MEGVCLAAIAVLVPLLAMLLERVGNVRISERHHSHHDTYVVPAPLTRSLVAAMAFMGAMGLVLGGLCVEGVLLANPFAVVGFFDAFVLTCFVLWWHLCRYRVSTFADCMGVRPFVGRPVTVRYEDIERLEWSGFRKGSGYRDLDVFVGGVRAATLSGLVDIEQILMRIDRFDALSYPA